MKLETVEEFDKFEKLADAVMNEQKQTAILFELSEDIANSLITNSLVAQQEVVRDCRLNVAMVARDILGLVSRAVYDYECDDVPSKDRCPPGSNGQGQDRIGE